MGWEIGYDSNWDRDIGYGVPATCDHPGCGEVIDRGLAHVCGGAPYGGDRGCGLFFCSHHLYCGTGTQLCAQCDEGEEGPFAPTPDREEWLRHKLNDESWGPWRAEYPNEVAKIRARLSEDAEGGSNAR